MSEKIFETFKRNASVLEKKPSNIDAAKKAQEEMTSFGYKRSTSADQMTPDMMLKAEDEIETYVRDAAKHDNLDMFDHADEPENKNKITTYIQQGIKAYKERTHHYISREHEIELQGRAWDELCGFGPLEPLLKDESVTEIMTIDTEKSYIERNGELLQANIRFKDIEHMKRILNRIISPIGREINESSPTVDARLPAGYRLNAVIPPIALNGVFITIRKFPSKVWKPEDLIRFGSAPKEIFDFLELCVKAKKNIIVSGGTGSGKTTLLNVLSNCIPPEERIITIEDSAELKLQGNHILSEEARQPNAEGKGAVTIRDLVKVALRQRPDRIVVGECRGGEALDMLQAMNTGHDGSLTTLHANSPRDAISRLEYMCMIAGDMPLAAIKPQIASAVGLIVQIGRVRIKGKKCRRTLAIYEVENKFTETGDYVLRPIFDSKYKGDDKHDICPTGNLPTFMEELESDFDFDKDQLKPPEKFIEPEP